MIRVGPLICAVLLACAVFARGGDWTVLKSDGRDYLSMRNVSDFYGLGNFERVGNSLTLGQPGRSLRGAVGSNELYINGLKFILSYPIETVDGEPAVSRMDLTKVIEPVLRPSRIRNAAMIDSVVLDPGHGGYDNGATSIFGYEKTYTLDVAFRTMPLLEQMGLRVYMTRTTDTFVPLEDRVRFANQHPRALFIAIHFNSGEADANGIETYTLAPRGVPSNAADGPLASDMYPCPGNVCDAENMALACATHAAMISHSQLFDRGIKRARFVVIRDITIPGVLVEGGFLSNPNDARLIATPQYREQEAQCLAIAVRNYRDAVNGVPPPEEQGHSVVMRDEVDTHGVPQPVGEAPEVVDTKTEFLTPATAARTAPQAHPGSTPEAAKPAPAAKQIAKAAPSPESEPAAQAQIGGSHWELAPIVD
ncbi:MAG TPA: N-acetylmuramoyl-L-alanine amidase [Chthoniobacteraceae bacterium]|jgi:N-acetylmuramoyl-L-alanine amidase|nr:N-acetylmuramoyl-L-alanine amidase [Chthoniobacteraceae bacterium]